MPLYQDYIGTEFETISELAEYRIRVQAPLLGGTSCPAADYTFAVSHDGGASWQNPNTNEKEALREAVISQEGCCRNLGDNCPTTKEDGTEFK